MQLDPVTFLLEVINFLVLIWILKRFLYVPIQKAIANRQQKLEQVLAEAKAKEGRAEQLLSQHETSIRQWQQEKEAREAQLQRDLAAERARLLEKIRRAAADEKTKLDAQREEANRAALRGLTEKARQEALECSAKLLQRLSTPALDTAFVDVLLEDIAAAPEDLLNRLRDAAREADGKVVVASAHALPDEMLERMRARLEQIFELPVQCDSVVRPELIGGLRVELGAQVLDANVQTELSFFQERENRALV